MLNRCRSSMSACVRMWPRRLVVVMTMSGLQQGAVRTVYNGGRRTSEQLPRWMNEKDEQKANGQLKATSNGKRLGGSKQRQVSFITEDEFNEVWSVRFMYGELQTVDEVIDILEQKSRVFQPAQLLILLETLYKLHDLHDIARIHQAYGPFIKKMESQPGYCSLLYLLLRTQFYLQDYPVVELLFRWYASCQKPDGTLFIYGLRAMLENNNAVSAKQFFYRFVKSCKELHSNDYMLQLMSSYAIKKGDMHGLNDIFKLWLDNSRIKPSHLSLARAQLEFEKFDTIEGKYYWYQILHHPQVVKSGYHQSDYYLMARFIKRIDESKLPAVSIQKEIQTNSAYSNVSCEARSLLYKQLLHTYMKANDFASLKDMLRIIQQDHEVNISMDFHLVICRYFSKNGLLGDLTSYLKDVVIKLPPSGKPVFDSRLLSIIWRCAVTAYPMLLREFENEFQLLFNQEKYVYCFPWLRNCVKNQLSLDALEARGDGIFSRRTATNSETKKLYRASNHLKRHDVSKVCNMIRKHLDASMRPAFDLYYSLMKYCVNHRQFNMMKFLETSLRPTYRYIPLKVDILTLRARIYQLLDNENLGTGEARGNLKVTSMINAFITTHEQHLNFQNRLQLGTLASKFGLFDLAEQQFAHARRLMRPTERRELYMYYKSLSAFYTLAKRPTCLIDTLRAFNDEPHSSLITHYWLRSIRTHITWLRRNNADEELVNELNKQRSRMVLHYADAKMEGLHSISALTSLLRSWLDQLCEADRAAMDLRREALKKSTDAALAARAHSAPSSAAASCSLASGLPSTQPLAQPNFYTYPYKECEQSIGTHAELP
ncbi:AaceriAGL218Wp [[Ashbya] aceris (nom. inval.)]|nr:AaceriAGL218Wp [[Ashbya] aceris (nom. inval.)]